MFRKVDDVFVNVDDMEKAVAFYRDKLEVVRKLGPIRHNIIEFVSFFVLRHSACFHLWDYQN